MATGQQGKLKTEMNMMEWISAEFCAFVTMMAAAQEDTATVALGIAGKDGNAKTEDVTPVGVDGWWKVDLQK